MDGLPADVVYLSQACSDLCRSQACSDLPDGVICLSQVASDQDHSAAPPAKRGKSKKVPITEVIQQHCCQACCCENVVIAAVAQWRKGFAQLSKPDADMLLFNLAQLAAVSAGKTRPWMFLGQMVCRKAMFLLTGAGRRLRYFRKSLAEGAVAPPMDLRFRRMIRNQSAKTDVVEYLWWLYESVGELLPDKLIDVELPQGPEADMDTIMDKYTDNLDTSETMGMNVSRRFLPPGSWYEAWLLYRADREDRGAMPA